MTSLFWLSGPWTLSLHSLLRCKSLDRDVVGVAAGGEHGDEGGFGALGAEDGDVAGVRVGDQQQVLVGGEGDGVGAGAGADAGDLVCRLLLEKKKKVSMTVW